MNDHGPTEKRDWLTCPTLWKLKKEWQPLGDWTPYILLGAAIGRGFEVWLQAIKDQDRVEEAIEYAVTEAFKVAEDKFVENDNWTIDALQILIKKGITAGIKQQLHDIAQRETIVGVEYEIGNGKIDLLTRIDQHYIITDHKVSLQSKSYYIDKDLLESETDMQLWDYAWRVKNTFNPAEISIRRHKGVLTPTTKFYIHTKKLALENLDRWSVGDYKVMEEIDHAKAHPDEPLQMNLANCTGRYGKCEMYEACHTCRLVPEKIQVFYERKIRS